MSEEEFLINARKVHGDKYEYSNYVKCRDPVIVTCKKHGEFSVIAQKHISQGNGCKLCLKKTKAISKEEFLRRANKKHGGKYEYYHYVNYTTSLIAKCKIHGEFTIKPSKHVGRGDGCRKCSNSKIKEATSIKLYNHCKQTNYGLSKFNYINSSSKIILECKEHGDFSKLPEELYSNEYCPKCKLIERGLKHRVTKETFIERANNKHLNFYNYDNIEYESISSYVYKIYCPEHKGYFNTLANNHIKGYKCNVCHQIEPKTTEQFILEASKIHGDKYDYSLVKYVNNCTNVEIVCKMHGSFNQIPTSHINCSSVCPCCTKGKSTGELALIEFFQSENILFEQQKTFKDCRNVNLLRFDFFLPAYNLCIEYDGKQHFEIVEFFGGEDGFKRRQLNDNIKNQFCKDNNINLLRISYKDVPEQILKDYFKIEK